MQKDFDCYLILTGSLKTTGNNRGIYSFANIIDNKTLTHMTKPLAVIHSNWHHYFDNFSFSSDDFYSAVEETINEYKISNVSFSRVNFPEGGILSAHRQYLRISRKTYIFDICAAPFARGFFVSWWLGERQRWYHNFRFHRIFFSRTAYFQKDTEAMFTEGVSAAIFQAIDAITNTKGVRALSEHERLYHERLK